MSQRPEATDRAQEQRVECVQQQGFVDRGHGHEADGRDPKHAGQCWPVYGQR